jgi:hypothetical protein
MFKKIPQRNLPISHISHLRSLKERIRRPPQQREKKEIHLALIARKVVTTSREETEIVRWKGEDKNHCYSATRSLF